MATAVVYPAMYGEKDLFSFFTKNNESAPPTSSTESDKTADPAGNELPLNDARSKRSRKPGRHESTSTEQPTAKTQKTLPGILKPTGASTLSLHNDSGEQAAVFDTDPNSVPRKRRRTSGNKSGTDVNGSSAEMTPEANRNVLGEPKSAAVRRPRSPKVVIRVEPHAATGPEQSGEPSVHSNGRTPPKKMLRLNSSGKFSSPPAKDSQKKPRESEETKTKKKRASRSLPRDRSLCIKIKYIEKAITGSRINLILSGQERYNEVILNPLSEEQKQCTPRKLRTTKATHPFFVGKPKEKVVPKRELPRKAHAITPGKLRAQSALDNARVGPSEKSEIWTSTLLKNRLIARHPGAKDPAWPSQGNFHSRGLDQQELDAIRSISNSPLAFVSSKHKKALPTGWSENPILRDFGSRLSPEEGGALMSDGFREPPLSLQIPTRLLLSGQDISLAVQKELRDSAQAEKYPMESHEAIKSLLRRIPESFSAFDEGRGESLHWELKYAPKTAAEVLQPTLEMTALREWLSLLTVTSVENTLKSESTSLKQKKKRRRKNEDLEDFLVESDEEIQVMTELSEGDGVQPNSLEGPRSIIKSASDSSKLSNAVLISGPNGCGKTAAAYAVAKELGFKVFELSPSERRSGKDILEKVGDMTENHLVKHQGHNAPELPAEEADCIDEAFERDLASGKQGQLGTFFQPKAPSKPKSALQKQLDIHKSPEMLSQALQKPKKGQQQSLILLEEVDVLFEEDKDFWTTVLKLIATSKRPCIMTCNDEDLVPLQAMSLHAILRLSPPPTALATDYLLLIAAAEGHLVQRMHVADLYTSQRRDLRASIAELDFWCQMGVGDPKGGLKWIYQRWPPGSDLDQHGRVLRVVSEGTFASNIKLPANPKSDETSRFRASDHYQDAESMNNDDHPEMPTTSPHSTLTELARFADAMSAIDVFSELSTDYQLDPTQPSLSDKARSQYIHGLRLLQTDERHDYSHLRSEMARESVKAARHIDSGIRSSNPNPSVETDALLDDKATAATVSLRRRKFACFDPIAATLDVGPGAGSNLIQSAFDGPMETIVLDLAPYVRAIVQLDVALAEQRERLGSVMGDGRGSKRARTTRAARSALEGSQRQTTRREKWFAESLDEEAVLATGGRDWPKAGLLDLAAASDNESRPGSELLLPTSSAEV